MSDLKIVCLARRGEKTDDAMAMTATVEVLPADECVIRYHAKNREVFWSRPGNFMSPEAERKSRTKGGERFMRALSFIDDPCEILPADEALVKAEAIRNELWDSGQLAAECGTI